MISWEPGITVDIAEKMIILQAFKFYRGNKTQTAQSLGIAIRTLDSKLERYAEDDRTQSANRERLQIEREAINQKQRGLSSPETRMPMESASKPTAEPQMSMSERPQVQEMLQGQASKGSSKRARASI